MRRAAVDALIFDLDGTLVDTLDDFVAALNRMLGDLAAPGASPARVDRGLVGQWVGKGSEHLIDCVLNHALGLGGYGKFAIDSEATLARAWDSYQRHYGVINGLYATVFPGVQDGLRALRGRGLPLACLTNKPTAHARALLQAKRLDGFFSQVFGGDAFERKKPDPLPLRRTCEALGTEPARTLMIGDSSNDAQAARGAGCPVLLVTYGYNHGEPVRAVDADGFLDSMAELGRIVGDFQPGT
ncbi:MAG: phosphoglycolate phosphatase [Burkholderiales bacterium]|nr:phosphoglycolate phosphatase [Burkholderiales bacterium]